MKKLIYIIAATLPLVLSSCGEGSSADVELGPLVIKADKEYIMADGSDAVTFTVTRDGIDITAQAVIKSADKALGDNVFVTRNAGEYMFHAAVGEAVSDEIPVEAVPISVESPEFRKHVAVWEFTGAGCSFCPSGYSKMNYIISLEENFKECVHILAFHSEANGADPMALDMTDRIMEDFQIGGTFPAFLVDMRDFGFPTNDGGTDAFEKALNKSFASYGPICGVALDTEVSGNALKVDVRLSAQLRSTYRLAVYVVEDRIVSPQNDGGVVKDDYLHRHVVRAMLSDSYRGDRVGDVKAGEEVVTSYECPLSGEWDLSNTYIYALAIDWRGYVNNVNYTLVGEDKDYLKN